MDYPRQYSAEKEGRGLYNVYGIGGPPVHSPADNMIMVSGQNEDLSEVSDQQTFSSRDPVAPDLNPAFSSSMSNRNTYHAKKMNTQSTIPEASHETDQPGTEQSMISQQAETQNEISSPLKSPQKLMKQSEVEEKTQNLSTQSNQEARYHMRIVCRIKPAKVVLPSDANRLIESQRARCSRSISKGCGRQTMFTFGGNGGYVTNTDSQSNQYLTYESGRSTSRERYPDSNKKTTSRYYNNSVKTTISRQLSPSQRSRRNTRVHCSRGGSAESSLSSERSRSRKNVVWNNQITSRTQMNPAMGTPQGHLKKPIRSSSVGTQPNLFYNKMLKNDGQYCIFTTRERSNLAFACDQPYSGKLLNDSFRTSADLNFLRNTPVQFEFDGVFDETSNGRQEKLYQENVRQIVHNFVEGLNGCVLLLGPSCCGKTYTLKGGQGQDRGIVPRAINDILDLIKTPEIEEKELDRTPSFREMQGRKRQFLKMSAYMIIMEEVVDLLNRPKNLVYIDSSYQEQPVLEHYLDPNSNQVVSRLNNLCERLILCPEDFYLAIADAYRYRKELSLNRYFDKELRKKCHFIISLSLVQQIPERQNGFLQISNLNFVELSGSEQAVSQNSKFAAYSNIKEIPVNEFVSKSFNSLSCHLMRLAQRKRKTNQVLTDDTETKLIQCLRQTLTPSSGILIINCIDPNQQMFEHCLPSLKFCASMREQINRKLKKLEAASHKEAKKVKVVKRKEPKHSQQEVRNLLLSQIKTSDKVLVQITSKMVDLEYRLEQNPKNQEAIIECKNFLNTLRELNRDFDTLIAFSTRQKATKSHVEYHVLNSAHSMMDKIQYIQTKIERIIQQDMARQQSFDNRGLSLDSGTQYSKGGSTTMVANRNMNQDLKENTFSSELQSNNTFVREQYQNQESLPQQTIGYDMPLQQPTYYDQMSYQNENQYVNGLGSNQNDMTGRFSCSKSNQPQQIMNDSFQHVQQFNTVDNRQVDRDNFFNYNRKVQQQITLTPNTYGSVQSQSHSRSRSREGISGMPNTANQGASYRSMRTSIDDHNFQKLQFPLQQQPYLASKQISVLNTNNMHSRVQSNMNNVSKPVFTNLIHHSESKFAKLRTEIQPPQLTKVEDMASLEHYKQQVPSNPQRPSLLDQLKQKQLYNNEDELVNDVCRLMLLQDQEGLKMRVLQLYRDREQTILTAQAQIQSFLSMEHAHKAQSLLMEEQSQIMAANHEEMKRYTNEVEEKYRVVESELITQFKEQGNKIKEMETSLKLMEDNVELMKEEKLKAEKDRDEEHKLKIEVDKVNKELEAENKKMHTNYEIIKEHEMNVIRECESRKHHEIRTQQDAFQKEREKYLDATHKAEVLQRQIGTLKESIQTMKNDIKILEDERDSLKAKNERHIADNVSLKQECTQLRQKHFEDVELIQILRRQQDGIKNERDDKQTDIQKLKATISALEKSQDTQQQIYLKLQGEYNLLQQQIEHMEKEKEQLKQQIENEQEEVSRREAEKELMMQAVQEEKNNWAKEMKVMKQVVAEKDKEVLSVKAQEYDKVDIIKKLTEAESRIKFLEEDKERITEQWKKAESEGERGKTENSNLREALQRKHSDLERMRSGHDQNIEQFDIKFEQLHSQMHQISQENVSLKEAQNSQQNKVYELEKERIYWKDKCRMAEKKGEQINGKIVELENELRTLIFDKQSVSADSQKTLSAAKKVEHKKQVFGDIQQMITKYRQGKVEKSDSRPPRQQTEPDSRNPIMDSKFNHNHQKNTEPALVSGNNEMLSEMQMENMPNSPIRSFIRDKNDAKLNTGSASFGMRTPAESHQGRYTQCNLKSQNS